MRISHVQRVEQAAMCHHHKPPDSPLSGLCDSVSHYLLFTLSLASTAVHSVLTRQYLSTLATPMFEEQLRVCEGLPSALSVSLQGRQGEDRGIIGRE